MLYKKNAIKTTYYRQPSRFKEAGFKALHFSGSMALESITIPKEVNESMSFLHQEILESNPTNLKNIIQQLKD